MEILSKEDIEHYKNFKPMSLEEIQKDEWLSKVMLKGFEDVMLNPYIKGEEAYFGPHSPLPECFLKYIKQMRIIYEETCIGGAHSRPKMDDRKALYKKFQATVEKMEVDLAKILNAEQVTVGLILEMNAFALPMCWDYNLTHVEGKKKFNENLMISLEDIVEHKDGFRFKKAEGKHVIIAMGLGLYNVCSDEEMVAIMLHELGHTFQHMLVTINGNVCNAVRKNLISFIYMAVNPILFVLKTIPIFGIFSVFVALISFIAAGFVWLSERSVAHKIKTKGEHDAGREIIMNMFDKSFDRANMAKELKDQRKEVIKAALKSMKVSPFMKIILSIIGFLCDTLNLLWAISLSPLISLVASIPSHLVVWGYHKYLRKERRYEQFADMFATNYGYGPYLASGLAKITGYMGQDFGVYNFIHYIPILNVWANIGRLTDMHSALLMAGYPPTKERIESLYVSLEYELAKNPKLTANQRREIKKQMDDIEDTFMGYVYSKDSKNFVYRLYNKMRNANLKTNRKTDVVENVLDPLWELREEYINESLKNKEDFIDPKTRKPRARLALPLATLINSTIEKMNLDAIFSDVLKNAALEKSKYKAYGTENFTDYNENIREIFKDR